MVRDGIRFDMSGKLRLQKHIALKWVETITYNIILNYGGAVYVAQENKGKG